MSLGVGALIPLAVEGVKGAFGWLRDKGKASAALKDKLAERPADWLLLVIFGMWAAPLVHVYIDPDAAGRLAGAMATMPADYWATFETITYVALGLPMLSKLGGRR